STSADRRTAESPCAETPPRRAAEAAAATAASVFGLQAFGSPGDVPVPCCGARGEFKRCGTGGLPRGYAQTAARPSAGRAVKSGGAQQRRRTAARTERTADFGEQKANF